MARAGRRQLEGVDEQTLVGVTRIEGEHPVVDVLLDALALVARGQGAASGFGEQAALNALGLGVVSDVLDNNAPFAVDVLGAEGAGVLDVARADEAFAANPVALVELFAVVERVVELLFLDLGDTVNEVVGGLVGNIGVLLQDERVVVDGVLFEATKVYSIHFAASQSESYLDVVGGVLVVAEAPWQSRVLSALGGRLRVAVLVVGRVGRVRSYRSDIIYD